MPKQNAPLTFTCTAGAWSDWQYFDPCAHWHLRTALGQVDIDLGDNYPVMPACIPGQTGNKSTFKRMRVRSTQTETVTVSVGDYLEKDSRGQVDASGASGAPVPVAQTIAARFGSGYSNVPARGTESLGVYDLTKTRRIWFSLSAMQAGPVRVQPAAADVSDTGGGVWIYPGQPPVPFQAAHQDSATTGQLYAFNPNGVEVIVAQAPEYNP